MTTTTFSGPRRTTRGRGRGSAPVDRPAAPAPAGGHRSVVRARVSSLPFLALIAALLGAGLLGLLMINNTLAAGSFAEARLKSDQILLGEREQALRQDVERLSSPTRVREAARAAGLVAAATTAYLDLSTGEILGIPQPAPAAGAAGDPAAPQATAPALPGTAPASPAPGGVGATPTPTPGGPTPAPSPADGAAVGPPPGGTTAYDRAIVSGGGR